MPIYWQDNDINKDWPDILKGTEKDAYPGITMICGSK